MTAEFVDTNVLLCAYDGSAGERHRVARELVGNLGRQRQGVLSVQVLQEFYVIATRKIAAPLSADHARRRLQTLSRWPTHSPLASDVVAASQIAEEHRLSFWDAMIIRSAHRMDCGVVWTEGLSSGQQIAGVEVRDPFS